MKCPVSALTLPCEPYSWVWHNLLQKTREGYFPVQWPRTHRQLSELDPATQTWLRGILWGILAVLCSYICLSNRVQDSLNSEGYQPSLCRHLRSLTTHSWPKIWRDSACQLWNIPYTLPFVWPGLVFTVLLCFAVLEGCCGVTSP